MLITVFTTRLLLEGLGVDDYGVYNVTIGIVVLCSFLQPAMANGIQRFFNFQIGRDDLIRAKNVFNTGIQIQLIISIIIVIICETIGLWYVTNNLVVAPDRYEATLIVYQISIFALVISMMEVPFAAAIMGHERMDFFALISISEAILKLGIALLLQYSSSDRLILYSSLLLLISLLHFFAYSLYAFLNFQEIRLHRCISRELFKPMLSFSGWNLLEKFAKLGKDQGINLMLNFYFGPAVNAARGVVGQVTYAFAGMVDSTITASRPQSIQSYARGDYQRTMHIMFSLSKFTLLMLYVLTFPIYLEATYILKLWLGDSVPELTIPLLNVALITIIIDKLAAPISVVVHATGKMKLFNTVSGVMNIIVLPFSYIALLKGCDVVTVYWIIFVVTFITQVVFVFVLRELIDYSVLAYCKKIVVPCFYVLVVSFWLPLLIHLYMAEGLFRLVLVVGS